MALAKLVQSGNSQALRLPKEFVVAVQELEIFRRGDEIVLREPQQGLARAYEILCEFPEDFLDDRDDRPPQVRAGL